jgi:glycosyltransferase involved in cell wall biosynthesis
MTDSSAPKIAYLVSMKNGIHSFIFRELEELEKDGLPFVLYPTQVGDGPYMPSGSWKVHRLGSRTFASGLLRAFFRRPKSFLSTLIKAAKFRAWMDFALAIEFSKDMEDEGISRVHCHFGDHKLFIGYFCGESLGLPVSVTIHAYELYNNPNPPLFRHVLQRVSEIVTISDFNKGVLVREYGVPSARVQVIRLFTDKGLEEDSPADSEAPFTILMVSRRVEKKGHKTLFEAVSKLKDLDLRLQVVGSGPLDLKSLSRRIGIQDRVEFLGRVSDEGLRSLYRGCDIFCLPSETTEYGDKEGIPVVLMEAMAYGKPVIATRHAGIPEIVEEILIDEGDSEALADGIKKLFNDGNLRARLGERNREIIREKYSSKNVNALIEIFRRDDT